MYNSGSKSPAQHPVVLRIYIHLEGVDQRPASRSQSRQSGATRTSGFRVRAGQPLRSMKRQVKRVQARRHHKNCLQQLLSIP
jgi:hypothetical protein